MVLQRSEEVDHKINSEEDADEDVDHYCLIHQLMLDYVQQEEEEYPENRHLQKLTVGYEVQQDYYYLRHHHSSQN